MRGFENIQYNRSLPLKYETDVFIAGGGPAGVAAAVSAAQNGAKVFLAEAEGALGGMGTLGLVPVFMEFSDGVHFVAAGIGEEILTRLRDAGGTGDENGFSIKAEALKRLYDEMLIERGVSFTFHTRLIDVVQEEGRVTAVVLAAKSGIFAVKAKIFVDATGDGDLAAWAGAPFEKGDEQGNMMPGSLCSLWTGIDWTTADRDTTQKRMLEKAFQDKIFTLEDPSLPGMWRVGAITGGGNIGHAFGVDGTDETSLTEAYIQQRKRLLEYDNYFRNYLTGYQDMELVGTGSLMGIRESRRIMGDYVLNFGDFQNRAVFEDEIGRYAGPVDIHAATPDKALHKKIKQAYLTDWRYQKGESYGIPYRTLTPLGLKNVLTAGRGISTDRSILGSVRVMPGCFITGQAAGAAAAICALDDVDTREMNVKKLQKALKEMGAFLPNYREDG